MSRPDWIRSDADHCWHPYTQHAVDGEPLPIVGASGAWLELADGRRMLDAISSWWTCLHGHGDPRLVRALAEQAARLDHVLFAGCTHEPAAELARRLVEFAPGGLSRVFYSDDGSTAVEVALKAAYQHWVRRGEPSRTVFLALEGGYHGDTFGSMAVGDPDPFFTEFAPFLFHVVRVPPDADALAQALEGQSGRVAGFIFEPLVQGAAGMRPVPPAFLEEAAALCRSHGALLIADEVLTGFGRTGTLFACEQAGLNPDLMCLAKGISGGLLPLAATLATEEVYASFLSEDRSQAFFHGHSFTANPIGCAVGLESLRIVREDDVPGRFEALGARIQDALEPLARRAGVRELRRFGGIVALELEDADAGYLSELGPRLKRAAYGGEVLLRPLGNVLYAMPPACVSDEECDRIAGAMTSVCEAVFATMVR